jgi:hypothetical protein
MRSSPSPRRTRTRLAVPARLCVLGVSAPSAADYPDWQALSDERVIELATDDEDGDARETKVWFVLLDGEPHLRTSESRWLSNLRRDPELVLHIEGREYEARAEEVTSEEITLRFEAAAAEKYGWQDRFIHLFRRGEPDILKLSPRGADY